MPRRLRVFVDGVKDDVDSWFAHGARAFASPEDAERFLSIVRDVKRKDELSILAWCLMLMHYHEAALRPR